MSLSNISEKLLIKAESDLSAMTGGTAAIDRLKPQDHVFIAKAHITL